MAVIHPAPYGALGNGAVAGTNVTVTEKGDGVSHQTVLTFTNAPVAVTRAGGDDSGWGALKIYDFPECHLLILAAQVNLAISVVGDANIDNAGSGDFSLGTTGTADNALGGTEVDILASSGMTDPFVTGLGGVVAVTSASVQFDGSAAAKDLYFNVIFDAGDVTTGNGTALFNGAITLTWINIGDD